MYLARLSWGGLVEDANVAVAWHSRAFRQPGRSDTAVVTNLDWDGERLIEWYRQKAGTIEHAHDELKYGLAAGSASTDQAARLAALAVDRRFPSAQLQPILLAWRATRSCCDSCSRTL